MQIENQRRVLDNLVAKRKQLQDLNEAFERFSDQNNQGGQRNTHLTSILQDINLKGQTRSSKSTLNQNAQKFKLTLMDNTLIRYECIYKNLLRDVRKVFTIIFNHETPYQSAKKRDKNTDYAEHVKEFVKNIFGEKSLLFLGISVEQGTFYMGSFIYPKYMIKSIQ